MLVESSGLEQVTSLDRILSQIKTDNQENLMGAGVAGSIHSVLSQCSPAIFEVQLYMAVYNACVLMHTHNNAFRETQYTHTLCMCLLCLVSYSTLVVFGLM